mgnify:CR=1 FL=1
MRRIIRIWLGLSSWQVGLARLFQLLMKAFLTDAAAMDMEDTGTNKYQKLVKSGIGSIIYSHSATDIPVHLSPGKYILKSVDPKTGAITVIAKRLNIKDVYMLKAEKNKDCIYWFHRI